MIDVVLLKSLPFQFIETAERWAMRYPFSVNQILRWRLNWGKWRYVLIAIERAGITTCSPDYEFNQMVKLNYA